MLNKFRKDQKGFTLIELLIVVAIIGILAAIAIPQFAAYRQRAFNGSAQSDLRNVKTAEESLFADNNTYGRSAQATLAAMGGDAGAAAAPLTGPLGAGTAAVAGGILTGNTDQDRIVGIGIAISNGVSLVAQTEADVLLQGSATYTLYSKHAQGPRCFATEAESTGVFLVENQAWIGQAMDLAANRPAPAAAVDVTENFSTDVANPTNGGGVPTAGWFLM